MPDSADCGEPPADDEARIARVTCAALLQLITEVRIDAGMDADGSDTLGRFTAIVGAHRMIAERLDKPGTLFDAGLNPAREALSVRVRAAEPIVARIAGWPRR